MDQLLKRTLSAAKFIKGDFQGCSRVLGNLERSFEDVIMSDTYDSDRATPSQSELEEDAEHLMANLMQAAIKKSGVSLDEFRPDHSTPTGIKVPQQNQAVVYNDTEGFLQLMDLGAPAKFGDLKAQANRLDPEVRLATEFSDFKWVCNDGRSIVCVETEAKQVLQGLFDKFVLQNAGSAGLGHCQIGRAHV